MTVVDDLFDVRSINNFCIGNVFGVCAGYALKTASRIVMLVVGTGFIIIQTLEHYEYILVDWNKIEYDLVKRFDTDGSGKLGLKDFNYYKNRVLKIVEYHGPSATGFSTGLYLGFSL